MVPVRYSLVRWVIVVIGIAIAASYWLFPLHVAAQVFLAFLLVLTAMSWIVPPGIYGWLVHPVCPTCDKSVEWAAVAPPGRPYDEQIIRSCQGCDKSTIEWEYRSG